MMDSIKNYLISVISAAMISGIAISIAGKKSTIGAITKLLTGLFLVITVISPWTKLRFNDLSAFYSEFSMEAAGVVAEGEAAAQHEITSIIKGQVEAYILDKASSLNLNIEVQVTMSDTQPPAPISVTIKGTVAPYGKQRLEQIICDDLGIAKENQLWT